MNVRHPFSTNTKLTCKGIACHSCNNHKYMYSAIHLEMSFNLTQIEYIEDYYCFKSGFTTNEMLDLLAN